MFARARPRELTAIPEPSLRTDAVERSDHSASIRPLMSRSLLIRYPFVSIVPTTRISACRALPICDFVRIVSTLAQPVNPHDKLCQKEAPPQPRNRKQTLACALLKSARTVGRNCLHSNAYDDHEILKGATLLCARIPLT